MRLDFFTDPGGFLELAARHLAREPVVSTVVSSVAERALADLSEGVTPDPRDWYVVAREGAALRGVAMRTAPFGARPLFLLPMPDEAALLLARTLHERGETVGAANGALPAVRTFADETARLVGASVAVAQHTRLFELDNLVEPAAVPGRLRVADEHDVDLALAWFAAFSHDADEQSAREPGSSFHELPDEADMRRRIGRRGIWLWEDEDGQAVHLTGASAPAFGVVRVGPVYTPRTQRGRGYASATVAAVSRQIVDEGARACLFTDQANPTSNRIYEALGYRPVVDMVNLLVE